MADTTSSQPSRPTPQALAGLLAFQPSSVVSRVLLKNKGGNVSLFAFDAGEGLSEHTAPFDALLVGIDGRADITIDGHVNRVGPGDALTLPANRPHAVAAVEPFKMLLVMIRG